MKQRFRTGLKLTAMHVFQKINLLFVFLLIFSDSKAQSGQTSGNMSLFASGLKNPVCIANAGDERLFVVEQAGYVRVINPDGQLKAQPFLDIRDRITFGGERGLLGIAFHPEYNTNGYFYVNYVGSGDSTNISRFKVSSENPEVANPQSELKLMTIYQPYANHNGGDLRFGPDGYLYIGLGDGGSSGDPGNRAQNPKEYLGKMLRIDVNSTAPYTIPATNPFYNSETTLGEIWALGLRNPWRFSFDRLTGDLWIADVGQNAFEEINFQPATSNGGENYGWKCYEGNQPYASSGCGTISGLTFPVHVYQHGEECSVTGGYVYRGNTASAYYGHYIFADYCSDRIFTLHKAGENWIREDFGQFPGNNFSTFGEDFEGRIYVAGIKSGKIYRVIDQANGIIEVEPSGIKIIQVQSSNTIRVETGLDSNIQITLYDLKGVVLYQGSSLQPNFQFDPGKISPGSYILTIRSKGKTVSHKFVKTEF